MTARCKTVGFVGDAFRGLGVDASERITAPTPVSLRKGFPEWAYLYHAHPGG